MPTAIAMAASVKEPSVYVGAVFDLSGPGAAVDVPVAAAVEAQIALLGRTDGVLGRPVELVVRDSGGDLEVAVDAAVGLVDAGADVLVLGCRSDLAAAAAAVAADHDVAVVSACSATSETTPDAANGAGSDGARVASAAFELGLPADVEGAALARAAVAGGATSAVAVTEVTLPGSIERCEAFTRSFAELGGQVLVSVELAPDGLAAGDVAAAVAATRPHVVVSCAGPDAGRGMVDGLRGAGWPGRVLTGPTADALLLADPAQVGDVAVLSLVPGPDRADAAADRRAALAEAAGRPLGATALAGAAALELFAAAAESAGSTDVGPVSDALLAGTTDTVVGPVTFDGTHRLAPPVALHLLVLRGDGVVTEDLP